jgi:hypothetical protein
MVLLDAGPRRAELLGMRLKDLDFEYDAVRVVGCASISGGGAADGTCGRSHPVPPEH